MSTKVAQMYRRSLLGLSVGFLPFGLLFVALSTPRARGDEKSDSAVAAIQKLGGKVERDDKDADKAVVVVNLGITEVKDAELEHLKGLSKLRRLTLNDTPITDAGLDHIKDLTSLQKLYLVDTKITDAGLERLKGLTNLQILSLAGTQVSDAGLEHLKGMSGLKEVFLYGTKVGDDGAKQLKEARPELKIFR
jgi:Leucine-rich repeat (LRR) protein